MSKEDVVAYTVMRYLAARQWHIVQYHAPGGQAAIHFDLRDGGRVVPDIIAYRDATLLVIECKGKYTESDIAKLDSMRQDGSLYAKAVSLADQYATRSCLSPPSICKSLFAHAFLGTADNSRKCDVGLIFVSPDGSLTTPLPLH